MGKAVQCGTIAQGRLQAEGISGLLEKTTTTKNTQHRVPSPNQKVSLEDNETGREP